ncbi:polyprotein [Panicum miliaceum]|uniref:Polyprotein n=1 Tax=Panicum miliaceum TaxID=4540 RepID=A0A3L6PUF7_PANMI|nr:polyprotein [Panicum miliaceum]
MKNLKKKTTEADGATIEGSRHRDKPSSPLTLELEKAQWPARSNAVSLPQYDWDSNPREFLLKYEATMELNGGGSSIKENAFVMAMQGPTQHWYASIPRRHIYSWSQLRSKLLTSFGGLKTEELTSCDFHNCKQGKKETLQEYMQRIIKMRSRAPNVADLTIIEAAIGGLHLGPCGEYLDICKPRTVRELFDIMQEYCKSD